MPTSSKNGRRSRGRTGKQWNDTRRRVLRATSICGICHEYVDQSRKWPDPLSPSVDHIIPVSQLDGPDDPRAYSLDNTRLTHLVCNQRRGTGEAVKPAHPTSRNWEE